MALHGTYTRHAPAALPRGSQLDKRYVCGFTEPKKGNILKRYPLRGITKHECLYFRLYKYIYMVQQLSSGTRSTPAATHGVRSKHLFSLQLCPLTTAHTLHISKSCKNHAAPGNLI